MTTDSRRSKAGVEDCDWPIQKAGQLNEAGARPESVRKPDAYLPSFKRGEKTKVVRERPELTDLSRNAGLRARLVRCAVHLSPLLFAQKGMWLDHDELAVLDSLFDFDELTVG